MFPFPLTLIIHSERLAYKIIYILLHLYYQKFNEDTSLKHFLKQFKSFIVIFLCFQTYPSSVYGFLLRNRNWFTFEIVIEFWSFMYHDICSLIKSILNKSKPFISFQNFWHCTLSLNVFIYTLLGPLFWRLGFRN